MNTRMNYQTIPLCRMASASSPRRVLTPNRVTKNLPIQGRTLWWWSRHGSWSSSNNDNLEDKMQKYQKVMRYRYSRALRRKAMWERDNSPPQWALSRPGRWLGRAWGCKPISTSEQMQARLKDEERGFSRNDRPWEDAHRDFESFKAAVDRAIAKDPVGFLFGRRLQGPLSPNNASWTSIARIFDSKASQESFEADHPPQRAGKKIKIESLDPKTHGAAMTSAPGAQNIAQDTAKTSSEIEKDETYVFDPITGRNVLKATEDERSITGRVIDALFQEHGAEPRPDSDQPNQPRKPAKPKPFQSSRSYEYHRLRTAALGSSLETTAQFGSTVKVKSDDAQIEPQPDTTTLPEDDSPPFTGTTYERSHGPASASSTTHSAWLAKEGFHDDVPVTDKFVSPKEPDLSVHTLQPSLDRVRGGAQKADRNTVTKLQPAADRVTFSNSKQKRPDRRAPLNVTENNTVEPARSSEAARDDFRPDTREDIDLLRASDVRAATKILRTTKSDIDNARADTRNKLEADFARRSAEQEDNQPSKPVAHKKGGALQSTDVPGAVPDRTGAFETPTKNSVQKLDGEGAANEATPFKFPQDLVNLARTLRDIYLDKGETSVRSDEDVSAQPRKSGGRSPDDAAVDQYKSEEARKNGEPFLMDNLTAGGFPKNGVVTYKRLASHEKQQLNAMRQLNDRIKQDPTLLEKPVLQPRRETEQVSPTLETNAIENRVEEGDPQAVMTSPFVILAYDKTSGNVVSTQLDGLMGQSSGMPETADPMVVMGNLNYPAAFVTHFISLEKAGYVLVSGGGDMLIFHKIDTISEVKDEQKDALESIQAIKTEISELKNKIANEEARNQPTSTHVLVEPKTVRKTAAVVDELPSRSPEHPTMSEDTAQKKKDRRSRRVRRQEQVFSGTIKPSRKPASSQKAEGATSEATQSRSNTAASEQRSFIGSFVQTLRTITIATVGLGVVAYTIGVVSEGMGAHSQSNGATASPGGELGPRKKMVMPVGQRPGIYSSESSRAE